MEVRTAPKASPILEALVVTLHDGRPGFSARIGDVRQLDGAVLHLAGGGDGPLSLTGIAHVVRSGTAYDEVRGRTRDAERWWQRGARRAETAVVVVDPDGS